MQRKQVDGIKDIYLRAHLAGSHLDLLAAVRLLDNAFKENADTEVVTDIRFMRERKTENEESPGWIKTGFFEQEYRTASVNRYSWITLT